MTRRVLMVVCGVLWAVLCRAQPQSADEILLRVVSIGVGDTARSGDWAGVLIELQDQGTTQRDVILEVETRDIDGDRPRYQRTITTNPGNGAERVWVYAYLQPADRDRPLTVSAYEALPLSEAQAELAGIRYEPGALLGRITTASGTLRPPELGTMLVIGRQPAGLAGYGSRLTAGDLWMARGHEATDIASDLDPLSLPDRAVGYAGVESIVWTSADPTRLTPSRANALRDWVRNGGHLIVSLPASPQIWFDQIRNPLSELLPAVSAERAAIPHATLRPLITYDPAVEIPESLVTHSLHPSASAGEHDAWPILDLASGEILAARRRVGLGCVTLIGFDVSNRTIASRGLPEMQAFWHRVLGRTGLPRDPDGQQLSVTQDQRRYFDRDLASLTTKEQAVVVGVLAGFGVFGVYWLVAAPLSYFVLSKMSLKQHAWLAFVAGVVGFTAATWGGVSLLRPSTPEVKSLIFLDAAEGTTRTSARLFSTVLVPKYGSGEIRVGDDGPGETAWLAPWTDSYGASGFGGSGGFPDVRGYAVSGSAPDRMSFPARSTVKGIRADWGGERRWSTFRAVDQTGQPGRLAFDAAGAITGSIAHGFSVPIEDTIILVVPPQERLSKQVGQADIVRTQVRRLSGAAWAAGDRIDLGVMFASADASAAANARERDRDFFEDLARMGVSGGLGEAASLSRASRQTDRLLASALMSRMPPSRAGERGERSIGLRRETHGLDLGSWFTQPSVIVLGIIRLTPDMELPLPLSIREGNSWEPLRGDGTVVVRWVYTLAPEPPDPTPPITEN